MSDIKNTPLDHFGGPERLLEVEIAGVKLKNPVIAASGCYGFGLEYKSFYPPETLGGIALKGLTLEPRLGNPPPRVAETPSGMLNSVGLQNPGVEQFLKVYLPLIKDSGTVLIANAAGSEIKDYCALVERLSDSAVDMIELNISCPNVKKGGVAFGVSCDGAAEIVSAVRRVCKKPLIVKLSPNVTSITDIAKAAEASGADAISLINTLLGMRIDIKTRRPILKNNVGGLSGPAVFPVAVRMVWQVANAVKLPVIGLGGIETAENAIEMMMAGASAVQVGTAIFSDPFAPQKIVAGLGQYIADGHAKRIKDITGTVAPW